MQSFIADYGYLAIFLLMLAESACIPVPSELIMLFGGALAAGAVAGTHLDLAAVNPPSRAAGCSSTQSKKILREPLLESAMSQSVHTLVLFGVQHDVGCRDAEQVIDYSFSHASSRRCERICHRHPNPIRSGQPAPRGKRKGLKKRGEVRGDRGKTVNSRREKRAVIGVQQDKQFVPRLGSE